jgi:hypothetical protein
MRPSPLTTVLLVVLVASALASVVLCGMYVDDARRLRVLQVQWQAINNNQQVLNALAVDCLEYSKKNPAIDPILETAGIKPNKAAPAAQTKPTGK